jgi:hypothetical protein
MKRSSTWPKIHDIEESTSPETHIATIHHHPTHRQHTMLSPSQLSPRSNSHVSRQDNEFESSVSITQTQWSRSASLPHAEELSGTVLRFLVQMNSPSLGAAASNRLRIRITDGGVASTSASPNITSGHILRPSNSPMASVGPSPRATPRGRSPNATPDGRSPQSTKSHLSVANLTFHGEMDDGRMDVSNSASMEPLPRFKEPSSSLRPVSQRAA